MPARKWYRIGEHRKTEGRSIYFVKRKSELVLYPVITTKYYSVPFENDPYQGTGTLIIDNDNDRLNECDNTLSLTVMLKFR